MEKSTGFITAGSVMIICRHALAVRPAALPTIPATTAREYFGYFHWCVAALPFWAHGNRPLQQGARLLDGSAPLAGGGGSRFSIVDQAAFCGDLRRSADSQNTAVPPTHHSLHFVCLFNGQAMGNHQERTRTAATNT